MSSFENNSQIDLHHWDSIRSLSLKEASLLIAGIDPASYDEKSQKLVKSVVYQRAIAEAVQRANDYAWMHARKLDRLLLDSKKNFKEIEILKSVENIWVESASHGDYLPSIEIENSIREVNSDPVNVAVLLVIDPWYSATIRGIDFISWLSRAEISSGYAFREYQNITVTDRKNNWNSHQNKPEKDEEEKVSAPLESAEKFAQEINAKNIPLSTRERNTLLSIIAVLCKEAKIDYVRCAKSAFIIKDLTAAMGLSIGESTIESHLKRIPEALEARTK